MAITVLDNSLRVEVYYEPSDCEFEDNICFSVQEECPEVEKLFRADETNMYLTVVEARALAQALLDAAKASEDACQE